MIFVVASDLMPILKKSVVGVNMVGTAKLSGRPITACIQKRSIKKHNTGVKKIQAE